MFIIRLIIILTSIGLYIYLLNYFLNCSVKRALFSVRLLSLWENIMSLSFNEFMYRIAFPLPAQDSCGIGEYLIFKATEG